MHKKFTIPKISEKEADELIQACRMAFGDSAEDEFFDEALDKAVKLRARRLAREEQTLAE